MSFNPNIPPNMEGLAVLLVLQDQVKKLSTLKEFGYFTTNETHRLLHFNTAYLWQKMELIDIQLIAQSEVAEVDQQTPVSQWLKEAIAEILKFPNGKDISSLNFGDKTSDVPINTSMDKEILEHWPEVFPRNVLWCPFLNEEHEISGGLVMFREKEFSEQEVKMFRWLANNYQYTWLFLTKSKLRPFFRIFRSKKHLKLIAGAAIIALLFPIRLSVLATGTVEAESPALINAPIPGIIKSFLVKPGDVVKAGQLLVVLDKTELTNSVEIDQKKSQLSESKVRSANSQGYERQESRSEIPILEAEKAVDQAELDYTKSMLAKADIVSPMDGIAVFDSKEDWLGLPVQAGETLLTIADPNHIYLKISLPVADVITLEVGAKGKFYMYGQLFEIPIVLTSIGYNAKLTPSKILAYQFTAKFTDPENLPRLGSQGTTKLYGHYVPLIYYILRRPLQALRQTFGF